MTQINIGTINHQINANQKYDADTNGTLKESSKSGIGRFFQEAFRPASVATSNQKVLDQVALGLKAEYGDKFASCAMKNIPEGVLSGKQTISGRNIIDLVTKASSSQSSEIERGASRMIHVCDTLTFGQPMAMSGFDANFISPEDTLLKELSNIPTELRPQILQGAAANIEDLATLDRIEQNLNTPTMQECTSLLASSSKLWEAPRSTTASVAKALSAHYNQHDKATNLTQALAEFKTALVERRAQLLPNITTSHSLPSSASSIPLGVDTNILPYTALKNSTNTDALDILANLGIKDPTVALAANIKSECATEKLDSLFRGDTCSGGKLVKKALSEPMKQLTPTLAGVITNDPNGAVNSAAILDAIKANSAAYNELCVVVKDTLEALIDGFSAVAKDKVNEYATKDMKPAGVFAQQIRSSVLGLIGLGMSVPASLGIQAEGISDQDKQALIKLGTFFKKISNEDLTTLLKDNLPNIASYLDGSIIENNYLADAFPTLNRTELTQLGYFDMKSADQVAMAKLAPSDLQALKDVKQSVSDHVLAEVKFEELSLVNKVSFAKGVVAGRETLKTLLELAPKTMLEVEPINYALITYGYSNAIKEFMNAIMPCDLDGGTGFEVHMSKIFNAIYQSSEDKNLAKNVFDTLGRGHIGDVLGVLGDKDASLRMDYSLENEKVISDISLSANLSLIRNVIVYEAICQFPVDGQENMSSIELQGAHNDAVSAFTSEAGHPAVQATKIFERSLNRIMNDIPYKSEDFKHNNISGIFIMDNINRVGDITIANERIESIPVIQQREAQLPEAQRKTAQDIIEATSMRLGELIPDLSLRKAVTAIASQACAADLITPFAMTATGTLISTQGTNFSFNFNPSDNTFIMKLNIKMDVTGDGNPLNGFAELEYRGKLSKDASGVWQTQNMVTDLRERKRLYNCAFA